MGITVIYETELPDFDLDKTLAYLKKVAYGIRAYTFYWKPETKRLVACEFGNTNAEIDVTQFVKGK